MSRVVVIIPAHDEAELVGRCLASVVRAGREALAAGCERVHIVLAAHRCTDATAEIAAASLRDLPAGLSSEVIVDDVSAGVGAVRRRAALAGLAALGWQAPGGEGGEPPWVASTDADSAVPPRWLVDLLAEAERSGALAVAGLVDLDGWQASPQARRAYEREVAGGIRGGGHSHVYGANLAVRADAYHQVGGFPDRETGEDVSLVQALRTAGVPVATPLGNRVRTSPRAPGRAPDGLGALIASLDTTSA